eukprot:TRINITY_DN489_c1_g1_i1.p1 TRINITY_DN489_c1_g1~~TRINITY_DN489_c1_g1_i1.p1  ORF type:complete len:456 (+),score=196.40 TRINITY_DN489_c1_g1_i1:548-1915(+)
MLPVMEIVLPTVSSNVPAFLAKLWKMVDDPSTDHLIDWSEEGNSFIIHNQADFAQRLLPYYYKHSNLASFVRQLNMYGFHKVLGIDSGGLKSERGDQMEFAHTYFLRGQGHLLDQIKRKISTGKNSGGSQAQSFSTTYAPNVKSEHVTEVLNEVSLIKDKQDEMDGKLDSMKKENEALWREVVTLRQKHQSQQKIVNKLIQFLVSLVQPRVGAGSSSAVKRRFNTLPLALEGEHAPKESRLEDSGPIIKDVTHVPSPEFIEEAPFSPMQAVDPSLVSGTMPAAFAKEVVAAASEVPTRPLLTREISKEDIDLDMNNMQRDLDNLKDILSGQVTLDTSIISNIFNPEEPLYSFVPSSSSGSASSSSSTPIIDDLLRSMGEKTPSQLQLECESPAFMELAASDKPGSTTQRKKTTILKISDKLMSPTEEFSELNTPAIIIDEDPLLVSTRELNGSED